jgi:hypothetical protein
VVSGVSVGAMIAPFAFLGPDYDAKLRRIYTNGEAQNLIDQTSPLGALFGGGLIESGRMRELVERYIDDVMLIEIAARMARGGGFSSSRPISTRSAPSSGTWGP